MAIGSIYIKLLVLKTLKIKANLKGEIAKTSHGKHFKKIGLKKCNFCGKNSKITLNLKMKSEILHEVRMKGTLFKFFHKHKIYLN